MKHFGNEFLELLKKDGLHGSFLSYEEYLELEQCETEDDFRALVSKTEYKETEVVDDVQETYVNFHAIAKVISRRKTSSAIGQIGWSGII